MLGLEQTDSADDDLGDKNKNVANVLTEVMTHNTASLLHLLRNKKCLFKNAFNAWLIMNTINARAI